MTLKPYLVFIGLTYYPIGGWLDFKKSFETRKEAKSFVEKLVEEDTYSWGQVIFIGEDKGEELVTEFFSVRYHGISQEVIKEWSDSDE